MATKRTRFIVLVASVTLLMSIVVFVVLVLVTKQMNTKLSKNQIEVNRVETQAQEFASLARLADETQGERAELATRILDENGVIDFLALIEDVAREQGVEHTTKSLDVTPIDTSFEELRITMSITGARASVEHVIAILETLPYQTYISNVTVGGSTTVLGDVWTGSFVLHVTKYIKL